MEHSESLMGMLSCLPLLAMAAIGLATFAFWVWMLVDCVTHETQENNEKLLWMLLIIFTQLLGAIIYYFLRYRPRLAR